jgi:hypothetical protein
MNNPAVARRRWFGLLFLILATGMLIWGQTVLQPHLRGLGFLAYWLVCLGMTGMAMVVALLDVWAMRRRLRRQQHELLRRTLEDLASKHDDPPPPGR